MWWPSDLPQCARICASGILRLADDSDSCVRFRLARLLGALAGPEKLRRSSSLAGRQMTVDGSLGPYLRAESMLPGRWSAGLCLASPPG